MTATDYAREERQALCDLFDRVGPDAPTLCEGWTTRDLAAHIILREGRPDAAAGILGGPLAAHAEKVRLDIASGEWTELVNKIRSGPPKLSVFRIPGAEGVANLLEFAIHHEDVRRAVPDWTVRVLDAGENDAIWSRITKASKMLVRKVPVGVTLHRDRPEGPQEYIARTPRPMSVTLSGSPLEIAMRLYGRSAVKLVVSGDERDVEAFESAPLGI